MVNDKPLQAKRNHHYVWAHYLKRWSANGRDLWHTNRNGRIILDSVRGFAKEEYFCKSNRLTSDHISSIKALSSLSPEFLQRQHMAFLSDFLKVQELEDIYDGCASRHEELEKMLHAMKCNMMENLHASHESEALTIIDELISKGLSALDEKESLASFLAFFGHQISRTRAFKNTFSLVRGFGVSDLDHAKRIHLLVEECWWFVSYMLGLNIGWSLYLSRDEDRHCLLINDTKTSFITSDQPVVNVHQNLREYEVSPPDEDTCDFFFPLSPKAAFMINKSSRFPSGITSISEGFAMEMNEKIAKSSNMHIIGVDEETVARYQTSVGHRQEIVKEFFSKA